MQSYLKLFRPISLLAKNITSFKCVYQLQNLELLQGRHNFFNSGKKSLFSIQASIDLPITENGSKTVKFKKSRKITNIEDILQYIASGKTFPFKVMKQLLSTESFDTLPSEEIIMLFECFGKLSPNSSKQDRNYFCQELFKKLQKYKKVNIEIYHAYIKTCTENCNIIKFDIFLQTLQCDPSQKTYKLLLKNACELGDIEGALNILEYMKKQQIPVDEDVFNSLLLVHVINGGIQAGEEVLKTMKSAQIPESVNTRFALIKGLAAKSELADLNNAIQKYSANFDDIKILELLEILGLKGNHNLLDEIPNEFKREVSRDFQMKINNLCIHLVHMDQEDSAVSIYKHFTDPNLEPNYGFFLLKEMLHLNKDINKIINLGKEFREKELNLDCLEQLTNIALRFGYVNSTWSLLTNLEVLKPHYFWPLLILANKQEGEQGIINVMSRIQNLNVHLDYESLEWYLFRYCDLSDPNSILKKIQMYGYNVRELLSPLIMVLLRRRETAKAAKLVDKYKVQITGDNMLNQLIESWIKTKDTYSIVEILAKFCESNVSEKDNVGEFLIKVLNLCTSKNDLIQFEHLLKGLKEKMLKINYNSSDIIQNTLKSLNPDMLESIENVLRSISEFQITPEASHIPHPRDMKIDELECHLEELKEKKMETRGVLRKLIILHCNSGNSGRVSELREEFTKNGYTETAGMNSSMFYSYVQGGHLEEAINLYDELKKRHPKFTIDSFKIIDFVALMVKKQDLENAFRIIKTESNSGKVLNSQSIVRNCLNLLMKFKDIQKQKEMFDILVKYGYCKPTNVLLGPLVRLNMKSDINLAVEKYEECSQKYKCTPLQLELLCAAINKNNEEIVKRILTATENVHGTTPALSIYAVALAENGLTNKLEQYLGKLSISIVKEMSTRCERWVTERKVEPLKTLAKATERISVEVVNRMVIYKSLMKIYSTENDCESAIDLFNNLKEEDFYIKKELSSNLQNLLKKCNYEIPQSLKLVNR